MFCVIYLLLYMLLSSAIQNSYEINICILRDTVVCQWPRKMRQHTSVTYATGQVADFSQMAPISTKSTYVTRFWKTVPNHT